MSNDKQTRVLGPLCKRGHRFEGTEQSLRYASTRQCVECLSAWTKDWTSNNRESTRRYAREHYHRNIETYHARMSAYAKTEAGIASKRRTRAKHRERLLERTRIWKASPRGKLLVARTNMQRMLDKYESPVEAYTIDEMVEHFAAFDFECVYCGSQSITVDHFLALSMGGADALWNLVPACGFCNASKNRRDALTWYQAQPSYSQERFDRIVAVLSAVPRGATKHVNGADREEDLIPF